jgi:serine/threonine-protein kinase
MPDGDRMNFADKNLSVDWADQSVDDGYQFTAPVGSYPAGASPYGALDMAGNVWDWVADWFDDGTYAASPAQNPTGASSGAYRVVRGGSWDSLRSDARAVTRFKDHPGNRSHGLGFRVVVAAVRIP